MNNKTNQTKKKLLTTWIISCKPGSSHRMPSMNITRFIYCTRISFHSVPFENQKPTVYLLNFQVRNQRLTNSTKRHDSHCEQAILNIVISLNYRSSNFFSVLLSCLCAQKPQSISLYTCSFLLHIRIYKAMSFNLAGALTHTHT